MSEVIVSGNVAVTKAPAPPPTIKVEMPAPVAPTEQMPDRGEGADIRLKHVSDPIEGGEDGHGLREEIRRQKREADPIYAWDASAAMPEPGPSESWGKQLRRASESQYEARVSSLAADFEKVPGANAERARRAAEFMADPPPIKVVPVGDNGQPILPLLDDQPVRWQDDVSFFNMAEANRAMKNYRDAQDRQAQALADELTQRQEMIERQAIEQTQSQQAKVRQEQEAARSQQAQAVHASAAARAQQEAAALQQVRQMSLDEAALAARIQTHERQSLQKYPEALNWEAWERTRQTNPARAAEIQREATNSQNAVAHLAKMQQERQLREYALGQHQAQQAAVQRDEWSKQQDAAFERVLKGRHPQFDSDTGRAKLRRLANEYLQKELGLTPQQIHAEWQGGQLRSAAAQVMLADAVAHKAGRESMLDLNSKRAPVPPVQRPGTYRPAGAGALDRIADLERQLDNASGNQSVKIATKLTQAKREAGLL
jgi:hypothetical protein